MKRLVFILTVIAISLYAHPTGGYYAPFDYGKVDLRHFDTTVEFDSAVTFNDTLTVNFLLIVNGKAYFFDTLFFVDTTLADTNYVTHNGVALHIGGNTQIDINALTISLSGVISKTSHIIPGLDTLRSLGTSLLRWKNLFSKRAWIYDSLYVVVNGDTGWLTIHLDTLRLNGNIPVKIGNSVIVDDDTTTINSCLRVISGTDTSSMDGYLHNALKVMRVDSISTPAVGSWTAFKFDTLVNAETFGSAIAFAPNNDSTKLHITQTGLYQYGGCIHWQNNSGQAQTVKVLSRITRRGIEVGCSQQEWEGDMGDGGESSFSFTGLMKVTTCDTLQLEYFVSNGNIDFISDANFTNEITTSLYLVKIR